MQLFRAMKQMFQMQYSAPEYYFNYFLSIVLECKLVEYPIERVQNFGLFCKLTFFTIFQRRRTSKTKYGKERDINRSRKINRLNSEYIFNFILIVVQNIQNTNTTNMFYIILLYLNYWLCFSLHFYGIGFIYISHPMSLHFADFLIDR